MPKCECEKSLQSQHSPCVISGDEDIIYCLIDPDLYSAATGKLQKAALSKSKLAKDDISTVRHAYSSEGEIEGQVVAPQLASKPYRRFIGVYICEAETIRGIANESDQDLCIADAGLPDFSSHAALTFRDAVAALPKSKQEAVRSNLVRAFEERGLITDLSTLFK